MKLTDRIEAAEALIRNATAQGPEAVEAFRVDLLGRNGVVTALLDELKQVPPEEKRLWGQRLNQLKQAAKQRLEELKAGNTDTPDGPRPMGDPTRPARTVPVGSLHPITIVRQRIVDVFTRIGYTVSQGPEVEDEHHNFGALNFPPDHPARDMQDTFFVHEPEACGCGFGNRGLALRTHTSSVQVRVMESGKPPFRTISPRARVPQRGHQRQGPLHVPPSGRACTWTTA
jgi:phenylalanyl-tRNA synthetase alpha chain